MTFDIVLPIWQAIQSRFHRTAQGLPESDLALSLNGVSIGYMLRHNAEVEYMFAEWFFGAPMPEGLDIATSRGAAGAKQIVDDHPDDLVALLAASNTHLIEAMRRLPEQNWMISVESVMGPSMPLEAIGRLMYHTGIHAGQISQIQKHHRALADAAQ